MAEEIFKTFDEETTGKFIEVVHSNECLWKVTSKAYKNKLLRDNLWANIAKQFNINGEEAYGMFRKLREKYRRERDKEVGKSGSAGNKKSAWVFLKSLQFLDEAYKQRRVSSSQAWDMIEENPEIITLDEETSAHTKDRSKSRSKSASRGESANLCEILTQNTKNLIEAINAQPPDSGENEDIISFVRGTLKKLNGQQKTNYEEELMNLSMQYRFAK